VSDARPELVVPPDEGVLFLTRFGEAFRPAPLTHLVRQYVERAELGKTGACHLFRHTCATLMLEGGADIRYIQELLGHVLLSTTQIYTQVSIRRLCEVYATTHPAAHLVRDEAKRKNGCAVRNITDSAPEPPSDVESLLSRLAAEQGEDDEDDESTEAEAYDE
jgi:integrase/recombinase XerD